MKLIGNRLLYFGTTVIFPVARLCLALLLIKLVAKEGGYAYLDAAALGGAAAAVFSLFSLPSIVLVRRVGMRGSVEFQLRASRILARHVSDALFMSLVAGAVCLLFFWYLGIVGSSQQLVVVASVMVTGAFSASFVCVEHWSGLFGRQHILRRDELLILLVVSGLCFATNWGLVALNAAALATFLARAANAHFFRFHGFSAFFRPFALTRYVRWVFRSGVWVVLANSGQIFSALFFSSVVVAHLPQGVMGQISLAYRFAGPVQVVSGQLSYMTWDAKTLRKNLMMIGFVGFFALIASVVLPLFVTNYLGLKFSTANWMLGTLAVAHLLGQGVCQIFGAKLYTASKYRSLFYSALPHLLFSSVSICLVIWGYVGAAVGVMALMILPTFLELLVLVLIIRAKSFSDR